MAQNLIIRQLGPVVQAMRGARQALYRPQSATIAGLNDTLWPNPLQPVTPMGPPRAEPLSFPMNWGRNLLFTPRDDAEYSAEELRRYSKYPLARICIENTKDMLCRMPHKIQLKPLDHETSKQRQIRAKDDQNLKVLNAFFNNPNPEQGWPEFIRPLLEDLLVIDAPSIFLARTLAGNIVQLRWLEGASITRCVDEHGWTPLPPSVAYQQLWQGYPRLDLTTDQLVYRPRNIVPRNTQSSYLYGYSPTEQLIDEIKVGIARLQFVLNFYDEGSIPGGMLFAPVGTPPDKIRETQDWLDSNLAGNLWKRRRLQIMQGFQTEGNSEQVVFPKEPQLADLFDEVHIRKVCFGYGTSPQRLMKQMNRASATAAQDAAEQEGTLPWMNWVKSTIDYIIQSPRLLNMPDYEFTFDPFHEMDVLKQAQADVLYVKNGIYTRNEKRVSLGDDPRQESDADTLNITTAQGVVDLDYRPPAPKPGGAGGVPFGGKASRAGNGSSRSELWKGCHRHEDSYPRVTCYDCVKETLGRLEAYNKQ